MKLRESRNRADFWLAVGWADFADNGMSTFNGLREPRNYFIAVGHPREVKTQQMTPHLGSENER